MPENKFNVIRRDGSVTQATESQFSKLEKLGYTREGTADATRRAQDTDEREYYTSTEQAGITAIEGTLAGATLGLSDIGADADSQARAQYNPGTRMASEIVSGVASSAFTGGATLAGAVGKGAVTLGKAVGGGVKGAIVAGAAEGAVAGAGQAVSRAYLDGEPLTVDTVFAGAGWGTIYGAGLGGVVGGVSGIAEKSVAKGLAAKADEAKAAVDAAKFANPVREDDYLRFKGAVEEFGTQSPEVSARASEFRGKVKAYGDEIATIEKEIAEIDKAFPKIVKGVDDEFEVSQSTARGEYSKYSKSVDAEVKLVTKELDSTAKAINKDFEALSKRYSQREEVRDFARSVSEMPDDVTRAKAIVDFTTSTNNFPSDHPILARAMKFDDLETTIKSKLDDVGTKGKDVETNVQGMDATRKGKLEEVRALTEKQKEIATLRRQALEAELTSIQKNADTYTVQEKAIKTLDRFPKTAAKFAELNPRKANELFTAIDDLMQKADDGMHPLRDSVIANVENITKNAGVVVDSVNPVDKLRKMWELAREADEGMKINASKLAAEGVTKSREKAGSWFARTARMAGARGASGAARAAGAGAIGSSVAYQGASSVMSYFTGGLMGVVSEVAGIRAAVQARVVSAVAKMNPTKNAYVRHTIPRIQPLSMKLDGTLDKSTKDKKQLATNRAIEISQASANIKEVLYNSLSPLVGEFAEFASSAQNRGIELFNALLEFAPRDPGTAFNNMKTMWAVNPIQAEQFSRALQVFHEPMTVIEEFMSDISTIDPIRTDALKKFYPHLYQDLRMATIERVAEIGDMNYANQARLANLLDLNLHSSFSSQAIAARQSIFMEVPEESAMGSSSPNPGGRPAKSGRGEPPTAGQSLQGK